MSHWQNKNKQNGVYTEELVLVKIFRQEKGYDNE